MWFNFVFPESHRPSILNIDYPHYRIRAHALRCVSFCLMQHGSSGMNWEDELVDMVSLQVFRAKRFRGETWKCKITLLLESKLLVWQLFSASCPKRLDKTTRPNVWITGKRRRWANYECVCVCVCPVLFNLIASLTGSATHNGKQMDVAVSGKSTMCVSLCSYGNTQKTVSLRG